MRVLLVTYEGMVKGEQKPFDKVTEENPLPVVVGTGELLKGLEEVLKDMKPGEEKTVELPPEKAFGERDPNKIAIIPLREFQKRNITPYPGLVIEADGMRGRVLSVSGGRVQVDFNHELAGKTVIYKVKVLKELKDPVEIAKAFFRRYFRRDAEEVKKVDEGIHVPYAPKNIEKDTMNKVLFVSRMLQFVPKVYITEVFERSKKAKK